MKENSVTLKKKLLCVTEEDNFRIMKLVTLHHSPAAAERLHGVHANGQHTWKAAACEMKASILFSSKDHTSDQLWKKRKLKKNISGRFFSVDQTGTPERNEQEVAESSGHAL